MKGIILETTDGIEKAISEFLKKMLDKKVFDAVLIPVKVVAANSYTWVLIGRNEDSLFRDITPIPPIMPVQGAKALSSVTRRGKIDSKISAIMRPCEVRAVIELYKLNQIDLENIFLISIDCPGVLSLSDYILNPDEGETKFKRLVHNFINGEVVIDSNSNSIRPICCICDKFTAQGESDLHIGGMGGKGEKIFLIPKSNKGEKSLEAMGDRSVELDYSDKLVTQVIELRKQNRREVLEELRNRIKGVDSFIEVFSKCINCHNCQSVCPICYCRQCYFDSENMKLPPDDYLIRAYSKGAMKFLPDTLLFHLGRMAHMSLSCVGCGTCEDACPMKIEVAEILSVAADKVQEIFNYLPGRSSDEPLPLKVYKEDEFHEVET